MIYVKVSDNLELWKLPLLYATSKSHINNDAFYAGSQIELQRAW